MQLLLWVPLFKSQEKKCSKNRRIWCFKWARARDGNVEGRDPNKAKIEEERDYEVTPA